MNKVGGPGQSAGPVELGGADEATQAAPAAAEAAQVATQSAPEPGASQAAWAQHAGDIGSAMLQSSLGLAGDDGHLVRKGGRGDEVADIQKALGIEADGKFGPATEAAVKKFQADNGCKVDGIVGPETRAAMARVFPAPLRPGPGSGSGVGPSASAGASAGAAATQVAGQAAQTGRPGAVKHAAKSWTKEDQFQHYAGIIESSGGKMPTRPGERVVLGMRGTAPDGTVTGEKGRNYRAYNDSFVVMWRDEKGKPHVETFRGSTTPGQATSQGIGVDVDRDGKRDMAHINPGTYEFRNSGIFHGKQSWAGKGAISSTRDTNHDGRIDDKERKDAAARGDTATAIMFHPGGSNIPVSAGCQTMAPGEYDKFLKAMGTGNFSYTLVDSRDADMRSAK